MGFQGLGISHGDGDERIRRRADAVMLPFVQDCMAWFDRKLGRSRFLKTARIDQVCLYLGLIYVPKFVPGRYNARVLSVKGRRVLEVSLDVSGKAVSEVSAASFREGLTWAFTDVLIDIGAKRRADVNELAQLRSKLRPPSTSVFAHILSDRVEPADPEDPFKYELEITIPLSGGWFGDLKEFKALQILDSALDRALDSRSIGMLETREVGKGVATFFLAGVDGKKMVEAVRGAMAELPHGLKVTKTVRARVRPLFSDAPGKNVRV